MGLCGSNDQIHADQKQEDSNTYVGEHLPYVQTESLSTPSEAVDFDDKSNDVNVQVINHVCDLIP